MLLATSGLLLAGAGARSAEAAELVPYSQVRSVALLRLDEPVERVEAADLGDFAADLGPGVVGQTSTVLPSRLDVRLVHEVLARASGSPGQQGEHVRAEAFYTFEFDVEEPVFGVLQLDLDREAMTGNLYEGAPYQGEYEVSFEVRLEGPSDTLYTFSWRDVDDCSYLACAIDLEERWGGALEPGRYRLTARSDANVEGAWACGSFCVSLDADSDGDLGVSLEVRDPLRFDANPWWGRRVLHIAHAGGECEAPTNTLYALEQALAKGADMLEFDVQSSADGELVVIHDTTVGRVTDGSGRVDAMTLAELKALDKAHDYIPHGEEGCPNASPAVYPFRGVATGDVPPPKGFEANDFRIATAREVLERFPDVLLSIEIKGAPPGALETGERLGELLRELGRSDDVLVASFDDVVIEHFKSRAPEVHTTPGVDGVVAFLQGDPLPQHQALQLPTDFDGIPLGTEAFVSLLHGRGMPVYFFLQENTELESVYDGLIDAGMDGVITGRPTAFEAKVIERGVQYVPEPGVGAGTLTVVLGLVWRARRPGGRTQRPAS